MTNSKITEIDEQKQWTLSFNSLKSPSFLQSWEWGELQKRLGYSVIRVSIQLGDVTGIAQLVIIKGRRGNFLFVPHGPILNTEATHDIVRMTTDLISYAEKVAKKEKLDFIRLAPILENTQENRHVFTQLGFTTAPLYMHAERVWQMAISADEEQLLKQMRKTTRYSIKHAEKLGVRVEVYPSIVKNSASTGAPGSRSLSPLSQCAPAEAPLLSKKTESQCIDEFWNIYQVTAKREGFVPFSKSYLINEFESFNKTGSAFFVFAYEKGNHLTAAALIVCTESTAFYHQGATLHSKVPSAYLLQWRSIQEAKKRGCTLYNFWGTYKKGRTPESWKGLSLFKEGFGGFATDYVETQDKPLSFKYWWTVIYETALKMKRFL